MEITNRWLGQSPYILLELEDDEGNCEVTMGGNPTEDEFKILVRSLRRSIRPLKKAAREVLQESDEQS